MNRIGRWLAGRLASALEPDQRNAVLGDLTESGATAGQALRDLAGLVALKQIALWRDWRAWMALFGIAAPSGAILGLVTLWLRGLCELYLWILRNRQVIERSTLEETHLTLGRGVLVLASHALLLLSLLWMSGFAMVRLSRRTVWASATALVTTWLICGGLRR